MFFHPSLIGLFLLFVITSKNAKASLVFLIILGLLAYFLDDIREVFPIFWWAFMIIMGVGATLLIIGLPIAFLDFKGKTNKKVILKQITKYFSILICIITFITLMLALALFITYLFTLI